MRQIKKRNRKPEYNKGYRGEIMREMLEYGGAVYKNFHLFNGQYVMYTRKVKQMSEEKIVEIIRYGMKDVAVLNDFEKNYEKYIGEFPPGIYKIYNDEGKKRRRNLKSGSLSEKERAFKEMETLGFIRGSKITTNPLEKTDLRVPKSIIGESETIFYTTKELGKIDSEGKPQKTLIEEDSDLENENESQKIPAAQNGLYSSTTSVAKNASRSIGCVISPGSVYVVYNIGNRMIEAKKATETAMRNKINMLAGSRSEKYIGSRGNDVRAIVLANDDKALERFITYQKPQSSLNTRRRNTKEAKSKFHIDFTYDKMYGLPINRTGTQMMHIITQFNWEKEMNETFLKPEEIENARLSSIVCDGYDGEHYILLYCKPDMVKLKQFAQRANIEENKEKFRVYCFDWQAPLVARITQGNAEIYKTNFRKYYESHKESE